MSAQSELDIPGGKGSAKGNGGPAISETKPLESIALSCHPDQVKEYNEAARQQGITGVRFREDGRAIITSRGKSGRAGWLKALGLHDNDGGYGDG